MEAESKKPTVGFIGTGRMGSEMARNILKNGYPLVVWNRTPKKCEDQTVLGAKPTTSPKDLARAQILNGDWTPTFTIELALKDTHLASELAREVSAPVPLGGMIKQRAH